MKTKEKYLLFGGLVFLLLIIPKMGRAAWYTVTDWLIPEFEGFRANPYWDVNAWRWGYGTPAPSQYGTITREQAKQEMRKELQKVYDYLFPMITRQLSANQWAALLSFGYNTGLGNADNLVPNINSGNDAALRSQWMLYDNSGGVYNAELARRRGIEWQVWQGNLEM